jgi:hypothetical protein
VDIERRRPRHCGVRREWPGRKHRWPPAPAPTPAPLTARARGRIGRAWQPSVADERQLLVAIVLHGYSFQSNGRQCHSCVWVAATLARYPGVTLRLSALQCLLSPGGARFRTLESLTSVTSWRLNSKKAQKRATLADRPYVGVGMRLRVLARATPCRGDRLIRDRLRAGKCRARTHAGILLGWAVGRGNVEKGCHEIVPPEGGRKGN